MTRVHTPLQVVAVLSWEERHYVATIEDDVAQLREGSTAALLAVPMDARVPKMRLRTRRGPALAGRRLVLALDGWSADSTYPSAHVVRELGPAGDVDVESEAILVECDLAASHARDAQGYNSPAMRPLWDHLPRPNGSDSLGFAFDVRACDLAGRRDLRETHTIMSIDPPGCVDIDDALSLVQLPGGRVELGVHIADVTHYVTEGSPLDLEAAARATTVYLVDRRLDMLPELLSTNLCSLRGAVDRCTISTIWTLEHREGVGWAPVETWFGRTLVRSAWEGSYQVAQAIINGETGSAEGRVAERVFGKRPGGVAGVRPTLVQLMDIAMDVRRQRKERGALELHSAEVGFGRIVALQHRSAPSYQVYSEIRHLHVCTTMRPNRRSTST